MASGSLVCETQTPPRSGAQPKSKGSPSRCRGAPRLTIDREVDPAAVVEGVVLLVQHEDFALVPALVLGADLLNAQGGFVVQAGPTCGENTAVSTAAPHRQTGPPPTKPFPGLGVSRKAAGWLAQPQTAPPGAVASGLRNHSLVN